jgi:serine protease
LDFLDSVQEIEGVYQAEPYYLNEDDSAFLVGLTLCVAFNQGITGSQIDSINAMYGVVIDHEIEGMANVFVLRNTDSSGYRLLDLANAYYELSQTRYAHPDFGVRVQKHSYRLFDYYSGSQVHIKKVIGSFNTASVWDFAGLTGDTIVVAVIDDGVASHEDLPSSRVLAGYDFADNDDNPTPGGEEAHGMACAGIIGASHTTDSVEGLSSSSGTISMNPSTTIRPVKIFNDLGKGCGPSATAAAITYAYTSGADVLSNSWGYDFTCPYALDVVSDAIEDATTLGRGGLGCPMIFSAGNWGNVNPRYPSCRPDVMAVGAVQLNDVRWSYSCYGSTLDIVAPSGACNLVGDVWTLDQMADYGYNPGAIDDCPPASNDEGYDCHFGGTSAAAPVVAGVASLILAKDPSLTAQEVYDILEGSAVTNLDWGSITPPDEQYGYGRVDAFRAILSIARGDVNNNGLITVGDISTLIDHEFITGIAIRPDSLLGDVNCDGDVTTADISLLIDHVFISGNPLPLPCFEFND